jgi:hypothetical protein
MNAPSVLPGNVDLRDQIGVVISPGYLTRCRESRRRSRHQRRIGCHKLNLRNRHLRGRAEPVSLILRRRRLTLRIHRTPAMHVQLHPPVLVQRRCQAAVGGQPLISQLPAEHNSLRIRGRPARKHIGHQRPQQRPRHRNSRRNRVPHAPEQITNLLPACHDSRHDPRARHAAHSQALRPRLPLPPATPWARSPHGSWAARSTSSSSQAQHGRPRNIRGG